MVSLIGLDLEFLRKTMSKMQTHFYHKFNKAMKRQKPVLLGSLFGIEVKERVSVY